MEQAVLATSAGPLLRDWRRRRRMSQLELALEADVSTRHLSFVETGRSRPSADMVVRLADELDIPLRDRNQILLAAGHAPAYAHHELGEPAMGAAREALERVLTGHEPFPALAVDRHWGLVAGNAAVPALIAGVAEELLEPPVNVLRLALHPAGLAPRIANLAEWRAHLLDRLARQAAASGDPALATLYAELEDYPSPTADAPRCSTAAEQIAVPLRLRHSTGELAFISTVTTFGTALDITLAELAVESFFPADRATAEIVHGWPRAPAGGHPGGS